MPAITPSLFRRACAQFPTGIAIAAAFDGAPHGLTVNSFTSISLRPPIVMFAIDRETQAIEAFRRVTHFAINILSVDQQELSSAFAYRPENRFEGVDWRRGIESVPLLAGALATLECRLIRVLPMGDHEVFFGEALAAEVAEEGAPLLYFRGRYARLTKPDSSL
jgi:flavin reductase (DIM6/NTAB) family NADH-FMN oxidoreductase RutF